MATLLKDIGSAILSSVLSNYINNIDPEQLSFALRRGELSLKDVTVKETALSDNHLPFKVAASRIGSILIQVPLRYTTAPTTIEIRDVTVLLGVTGNVIIETDLSSSQKSAQKKEKKTTEKGFISKMLYGVMEQIIANLRFKLSNVHIRVEHNKGKTIAGGLIIREIECFTVDENLEPVMVATTPDLLLKKLSIEGLSIYMDTETSTVSTGENFVEDMNSVLEMKHEYVLHDFSVTGILKHPKVPTEGFANEIEIDSPGLSLALTRAQYIAYELLQHEIALFSVRRYYAKCGVPDRLPRSERSAGLWWRYASNCADLKRNPKVFKVDTALTFLQNREKFHDQFVRLFESPENEDIQQEMNELEETLGNEAYILLLVHARMRWTKSRKHNHKVTEEEMQVIENAEMFATSGLKVVYNVQKFNINFVTDSVDTARLQLSEITGLYTKQGPNYLLKCEINNILMQDSEEDRVFELLASESDNCTKVTWTSNGMTQKKKLSFLAKAPNVLFKTGFVDEMTDFFAKTIVLEERVAAVPSAEQRENTKFELTNLIETHQALALDLHFESPKVKIPTPLPIYVNLGTVDIKSIEPKAPRNVDDVASFYDEYSVLFNGFELKMDEKHICNPVSTSVKFYRSFVVMKSIPMTKIEAEVDSIVVQTNRIQYMTFLTFTDMIRSTGKRNPKQNPKKATRSIKDVQPPSEKSVEFSLKFKQFDISVLDLDGGVYSQLIFDNIRLYLMSLKGDMKATFQMFDCTAFTASKKELFKFKAHEDKDVFDLLLSTENDKKLKCYFRATEAQLFVDVVTLKNTMQFFQVPSRRRREALMSSQQLIEMATTVDEIPDDDDALILKKFSERMELDLDVQYESPQIILPLTDDKTLLIALGSMSVNAVPPPERSLDNTDSFYDTFKLNLDGFAISISDEYIIPPVSVTVLYYHCFVNRKSIVKYKMVAEVDSIHMGLTREQYVTVLSIPAMMKANKRNEKLLHDSQIEQSHVQKEKRPQKQSTGLKQVKINLVEIKLIGDEGESNDTLVVNRLVWQQQDLNNKKEIRADIGSLGLKAREKLKIGLGDFDSNDSFGIRLSQTKGSACDHTEVKAELNKVIARVSFEYVWRIKAFLQKPPSEVVEESTPEVTTEPKAPALTTQSLNVNDVSVTIGFKGLDQRHHVTILTESLDMHKDQEGKQTATGSGIVLCLDERRVSKPFSLNFENTDAWHVDISEMDMDVISTDYRFCMDLVGYYRVFVPKPVLPDVLTEEHYRWTKYVTVHKLTGRLSEDGKELYSLVMENLHVRMCQVYNTFASERLYVEETMLEELHPDRRLMDSPGFEFSMFTSKKEIKLMSGTELWVKQQAINWLYRLVVFPTGIKQRMLDYTRGPDSTNEFFVKFIDPTLHLLPPGKDHGVMKCHTIDFHFLHIPGKPGKMRIGIDKTKVTCNHLGVFHDFLEWDELEMNIQMPNIATNFVNAKFFVQYELFMETFRYLMAVIANGPPRVGGPFRIGAYNYDVKFDRLFATMLPRRLCDPNYCLQFDMRPFTVVTGESPRFIVMKSDDVDITTPQGKKVAKGTNFDCVLEFELLDPSLLEEQDKAPNVLCLHKWITCANLKYLEWIYNRTEMGIFLAVLQSFFKQEIVVTKQPDPFAVQFDTTLRADKFIMEFNDPTGYICTLNSDELYYHITTQQDVTIKHFTVDRNGEVFVLSHENEDEVAITWVKTPDKMETNIVRMEMEVDYRRLGRLTTAIMVSPILSFRVRPPPPDEKPNLEHITTYRMKFLQLFWPVEQGKRPDVLITTFDEFVFSMKQDKMYEAENFKAMFAPSKDGSPYRSFLELQSFKFHTTFEKEGRLIIFNASPFQMTIGAVDIVSFMLLQEGVRLLARESYWEPRVQQEQIIKYTRVILAFGSFSISLCRENRYSTKPILEFKFDVSKYFVWELNTASRDQSLMLTLSSLLYMNPNTGLPDEIVESVGLNLQVLSTALGSKVKFGFMDEVNFHISFEALNDILSFITSLNKRIAAKSTEMPPKPVLSVVNQTGIRGWFLINQTAKMLEQLETFDVDMSEVADDCKIYYQKEVGIQRRTAISPQRIHYPIFIDEKIVVSARRSPKGMKVKFSSLLRFKNTLNCTLGLLSVDPKGFKVVALIPGKKSVGLPVLESTDAKFAITDRIDQPTLAHRTFMVHEVRKEPKIVRCLLKRGNYDLLLRSKMNETTFILTISIESLVVAINHLPFEIKLTAGGDKPKRLPIDVPVSLPKINYTKSFKGTVSRSNAWGDMVTISTTVDETTEIPVGVEEKMSIAVDAMKQDDSPQIQLVFYAPLIIYNRSSQPLLIGSVDGKIHRSFESRTPDASKEDDGILLWGTSDYFMKGKSEKSLLVRVLVPYDRRAASVEYSKDDWVESEPIDAAGNGHKTLMINNPIMRDTYITLHYNVQSAQPYAKSRILTLFSQFKARNQLSMPVILQPLKFKKMHNNRDEPIAFGIPITLEPGQTEAIVSTSALFCFCFYTPSSPFPVPLDFRKMTHRTFLSKGEHGPQFIDFRLEERGLDMLATFKPASFVQPLMVANQLDIDISYSQYGLDNPIRIPVAAHSTSILGLEYPYVMTAVSLHIQNKQVTVDFFTTKHETIDGMDVYIEVRACNNQSHIIHVTTEPLPKSEPFDFTVKLEIPALHVSLIDGFAREFLLFSMRHIQLVIISSDTMNQLNLFIHSIQLDDLHPLAVYPVAMVGASCGNYHFLEFRCSVFTDGHSFTHFDQISVRLQNLYIFMDMKFLSDLLNFLTPQKIGSGRMAPPVPSSSRAGLGHIPFSVNRLTVFNTTFYISSRRSTDRPTSYPLFSRKLRFVPNISNFNLEIPGYRSGIGELSDISAVSLQDALISPYKQAITDQFYGILACFDFMAGDMGNIIPRGSRAGAWLAEEIKSALKSPVRIARAMPKKQIGRFDPFASYVQMMIQRRDLSSSSKFAKETIELYIDNLDTNDTVVCITQKYIFEVQGASWPVIVMPFFKIRWVTAKITQKVIVHIESTHPKNKGKMDIRCQDEATAEEVATYLSSKKYALGLGKRL